MEDNYGMMDLHYAMVMLGGGGGIDVFGSDSTTMGMGSAAAASGHSGDSGGASGSGLEMEIGGRWPKEETLALLEIRTRLDFKFKEATHKGHLWDEVSRIMYVEHGYKRSGKKCSVKFENLYKYYKKIKDGKVGRQDKIQHYKFFHQLEAISGGSNTNTRNTANPISVTNATFRPSPPVEDNNHLEKMINKRMLGKKHWKTKITDSIEAQMNTLMEKQEKWMEKVMYSIEEKEKERILKEKEWRKQEAARLDREKMIRASERARMEHRHTLLMEALHKLTKINESTIDGSYGEFRNEQEQIVTCWGENETTQLIQLRSNMETRFEKLGDKFMEDVLWEEIAITMASLGYNRSALMCKAKWDHINFLLRNHEKQKGSSNLWYGHHHNHIYDHQASDQRLVRFNDPPSQPHEMMWN
ncbi:hypothetical protein QVD17_14685 [Tagetes erecta]|uniref:Myb-like domain-containing protein n=1 Tax=Tagetes erecta TaxID=13708 RepID=A0AAD8NY17_TARER|nr:hypothetical protein QVD17_14685 [Tagetes erecta]